MGHASYGNNSQQDSQTPDRSNPHAADRKPKKGKDLPAAGPHDKPGLTSDEGTPGAGTLPDAGARDATDSTSG